MRIKITVYQAFLLIMYFCILYIMYVTISTTATEDDGIKIYRNFSKPKMSLSCRPSPRKLHPKREQIAEISQQNLVLPVKNFICLKAGRSGRFENMKINSVFCKTMHETISLLHRCAFGSSHVPTTSQ